MGRDNKKVAAEFQQGYEALAAAYALKWHGNNANVNIINQGDSAKKSEISTKKQVAEDIQSKIRNVFLPSVPPVGQDPTPEQQIQRRLLLANWYIQQLEMWCIELAKVDMHRNMLNIRSDYAQALGITNTQPEYPSKHSEIYIETMILELSERIAHQSKGLLLDEPVANEQSYTALRSNRKLTSDINKYFDAAEMAMERAGIEGGELRSEKYSSDATNKANKIGADELDRVIKEIVSDYNQKRSGFGKIMRGRFKTRRDEQITMLNYAVGNAVQNPAEKMALVLAVYKSLGSEDKVTNYTAQGFALPSLPGEKPRRAGKSDLEKIMTAKFAAKGVDLAQYESVQGAVNGVAIKIVQPLAITLHVALMDYPNHDEKLSGSNQKIKKEFNQLTHHLQRVMTSGLSPAYFNKKNKR